MQLWVTSPAAHQPGSHGDFFWHWNLSKRRSLVNCLHATSPILICHLLPPLNKSQEPFYVCMTCTDHIVSFIKGFIHLCSTLVRIVSSLLWRQQLDKNLGCSDPIDIAFAYISYTRYILMTQTWRCELARVAFEWHLTVAGSWSSSSFQQTHPQCSRAETRAWFFMILKPHLTLI